MIKLNATDIIKENKEPKLVKSNRKPSRTIRGNQ